MLPSEGVKSIGPIGGQRRFPDGIFIVCLSYDQLGVSFDANEGYATIQGGEKAEDECFIFCFVIGATEI
ncbi:hypothetical protein Vadar_009525 [Vaccinium darrowii]|uniref:Uncharacterized protein n=1 Tax=Vaccinium darrowii TaxID=229202 RepID=A0ACB7X8G1_9ERIC|nr:hypothetical protein Vadar_009525 [Vaccinium darrowii]